MERKQPRAWRKQSKKAGGGSSFDRQGTAYEQSCVGSFREDGAREEVVAHGLEAADFVLRMKLGLWRAACASWLLESVAAELVGSRIYIYIYIMYAGRWNKHVERWELPRAELGSGKKACSFWNIKR